jgi:hypothetical protein
VMVIGVAKAGTASRQAKPAIARKRAIFEVFNFRNSDSVDFGRVTPKGTSSNPSSIAGALFGLCFQWVRIAGFLDTAIFLLLCAIVCA